MDNNINKIIPSLAWTYISKTLSLCCTLIITIILSRIIDPDDYGAIAIVTIFISIAQLCLTSGFASALIQKRNADSIDFSTVFYFSLIFSVTAYIIIYFMAPIVAIFFDMPILTSALRITALSLPAYAVYSVLVAVVSKRMNFKVLLFPTLIGNVLSGIVGIMMAYYGYGIWALVAQSMISTITIVIILWILLRWKLTLEFSLTRLVKLFSYGWKVFLTELMMSGYTYIQNIAIGKKYSAAELAYSDKATQFPSIISGTVNGTISTVLFPAMSQNQDDMETIKQIQRRAIKVPIFLQNSILFGLAAISTQFVTILLTEKWLPCVPYLIIMCVVWSLQPIQTANLQAIKAIGKSGLYLRLEIIKKMLQFLVLIITIFCFNSVLVILFGMLISQIIAIVVNIPVNKKLFNYRYKEQFNDVFPIYFISIIMFTIVWSVQLICLNIYLTIVLQIIIGIIIYISLSYLLKIDSLKYSITTIREYLCRK